MAAYMRRCFKIVRSRLFLLARLSRTFFLVCVLSPTQELLLFRLAGWKAYGGVTISVVNNTPGVSKALPNSLQVRAPPGVTGKVGFENTGYWGMKSFWGVINS